MTTPRRRPIALIAVIALALPLTLQAAPRQQPEAKDLTPAFREQGIAVDRLQVAEIGGIVIIRGRTMDHGEALEATKLAQSLGYKRIANLIHIVAPVDDDTIERLAERELTIHRSLDGCAFRIASVDGIVQLGGKVSHELQKDVAVQLVRNIDGVRAVRAEFQRF